MAFPTAFTSSQAEGYQAKRRQQLESGEWYLSPREFSRAVGVSATTRDYWHENGIPILDGEFPDVAEFPDANGMLTPYWSEQQALNIIDARKAKPKTIAAAA